MKELVFSFVCEGQFFVGILVELVFGMFVDVGVVIIVGGL